MTKTSRSRLLRLLPVVLAVLTAVLFIAPFLFKAAHRLEEPAGLEAGAVQAALSLARAAVESGAGLPATVPDGAVAGLEATPSGPVFVTVYGVGLTGRKDLPVGIWTPGGQPATLAGAIREAGLEAGRALASIAAAKEKLAAAQGQASPVRIKLDLAGPARGLRMQSDSFLELVIDPGRDGVLGEAEGRRAWFLPSWTVERGWKVGQVKRWLQTRLIQRDKPIELSRFRTRSWIEGTADEPGPLPLFRGNVLVNEVSSSTVRRSLLLGGRYLARMVGPDGRYCYTYDAGNDRCDKDYNLLRHGGTTYSLYQIYQVTPEPEMLEAAERATEWMRRQVRLVDGDPSRAYMLEGDKAKLGAVGLGLLALVERERVVKDGRDRELMRKMADFVRSQQREDGFLYSWFEWKKGVRVPKENSIYYPGEALLGLVRLHDIDPEPRFLETATKAAEYLALNRWRWAGIELYVPPDAWLTQGIAEMYEKVQDPRLKDYCYELIEVTEVTQLRAEEGAPPDMAGGPANGFALPSVTPAGSRNEGMTAAWHMARFAKEEDQVARIRGLALRGAGFQLSQQFRPANSYFLPNQERALGGFRSRADKLDVRIDYVQHNATGLIGVLEILKQEGR